MSSIESIWHCRACGRTAETARGLTSQGCEGTHEEFVPVAELEAEVERLRGALAWACGFIEEVGGGTDTYAHIELARNR